MRRHITAQTILEVQEKYDNRYFIVNTDEERNKVCLKLLREREADGYWYPSRETLRKNFDEGAAHVLEKYGDLSEVSEKDVKNLPESLKKNFLQEKERFDKALAHLNSEYDTEMHFRNRLDKLLNATDEEALEMKIRLGTGLVIGLAVYLIYHVRGDYQYEGIQEIDPESL